MTDPKTLAQQGVKEAQTNTAVVQHNAAADSIEATFQKLMPKLAQASLAKVPPEFIVSTAMTVLRNSEQLKSCDPLSVVHCVVQSAQTGLRLDPVLQQAALVSRWNSKKGKNEAQFMPMYKGLLLLSRRSGKIVHVAAQPVYEGDEFSYGYGSDQFLSHRPSLKRDPKAKITHYYAYIKLVGGGFQFEVMTQEEIDEVKEFALGDKKNKAASPWTTDPIPMALKTVLRRALKLAPVEDPMLAAAIQADEMLERGIVQEHVVENGLVVPGASYQEAEAEAATEKPVVPIVALPAVHVDTAKTVDESGGLDPQHPLNKKEKTDEQVAWVKTCVSIFETLKKKENREKAVEWAKEAKRRHDEGLIADFDFEVIVAEFRKHFPAKPAPTPSLFGADGSVQPGDGAVVEQPKAKADDGADTRSHRPRKGKKAVGDAASDLSKQIAEAEKLSILFTIKGRIEKAAVADQDHAALMAQWQAKVDSLKGAKK